MRKPKDKNKGGKVNRLDVCGMKRRWKDRMRFVAEVEMGGGKGKQRKKGAQDGGKNKLEKGVVGYLNKERDELKRNRKNKGNPT